MAAISTTNSNSIRNEPSRQEVQAAIAKAAELRAIHAALMQANSPTHSKLFPSSSPPPPIPHSSQLSAHDYPIFTPSYEDEPLPAGSGYCNLQLDNRVCCEGWSDHYGENGVMQTNYTIENVSSRKELPTGLANNIDSHSVTSSCTNQITVLQTSPLRSRRRNSLGDFKSVTSKCKHNEDADSITSSNCKHSNIVVVPLTDSHMAVNPHQNNQHPNKTKVTVFSRLFPMRTKKPKDTGLVAIDSLKKELLEANQKRDAALAEVAEIRSSFGELRRKLENLEGHCEELKKAVRQSSNHVNMEEDKDNGMPVSEEVMVEGFLQIVSEARLSVKQFCKILVGQIQETDDQLNTNLNTLLKPYNLSLTSKHSKAILYHLEALINQTLYQDFENSVFQKNGPPKLLDPHQDRQAQFSSFVALRNLSWNEVVKKGTKYHSEEFSKFCDQRMSCIITTLNWIRPWPEQLLQSFFVAAKCVWLLHLLAFSFCPPLMIMRVEENRAFDGRYMEELVVERQRSDRSLSQVKIMVMPGFYVQDKIIRSKVICRGKSIR
ncbi:hypothetical protein V2J09_000985 [Rumex salicifolius]